ncbi:MAG: T9SS type A sorting domain-containing protein [Bacteroidota bacterium]
MNVLQRLLITALTIGTINAEAQVRTWNCSGGTAGDTANGNSIEASISSSGLSFASWGTGTGFFRPRGSNPAKNLIFSASLWGAGRNSADTTAVQYFAGTFNQGGGIFWWPGPILGRDSTSTEHCSAWNHVFKIKRSETEAFRNAFNRGQILNAFNVPPAVATWPGRGNTIIRSFIPDFPAIQTEQAPFIDADNDGVYNPLNGDYPDFQGEQALYTVVNSIGNIGGRSGDTLRVAWEYHNLVWQIKAAGVLDSTLFIKSTIINKSAYTIKNFSLGQWNDFDIGFFGTNYAGSDYGRSAAYSYRTDIDSAPGGYGRSQPYIALKILTGISPDLNDGKDNNHNGQTDEPGETFLPNIAQYYSNGSGGVYGDPSRALDYYNYLQGNWKNGKPATYDNRQGTSSIVGCGTTPCVKAGFVFPGKSLMGADCPISAQYPGSNCSEWSELTARTSAADRRMLIAMSGFTFLPNSEKKITMAYNFGIGSTVESSLRRMEIALDSLQLLYNSGIVTGNRHVFSNSADPQLYPNPSGGQMPFLKSGGKALVKVYNIQGSELYSANMEAGQAMPDHNLPAGLYLVHILSGKEMKTIKWVKEF